MDDFLVIMYSIMLFQIYKWINNKILFFYSKSKGYYFNQNLIQQ